MMERRVNRFDLYKGDGIAKRNKYSLVKKKEKKTKKRKKEKKEDSNVFDMTAFTDLPL